MAEFIGLLLNLAVPIGLLALGIFVGGATERRHLRELAAREQAVAHMHVNNLRTPSNPETIESATMVVGQVVIATDYFKTFATWLRGLVGGEMRAARTLMLRARREALLRAIDEAQQMHATELWNVRYGFSTISAMNRKKGAMQVEIIAWGTAIRRKPLMLHASDADGQA